MAAKKETFGEDVAHFYHKWKSRGKRFTVDHFVARGKSKSYIYKVLNMIEAGKDLKRKAGSGMKLKIMTRKNLRQLKRMFHDNDKFSQRDASRKFGVGQSVISYHLKNMGIKAYKKIKSAEYTVDQESDVKAACLWMYRNSVGDDFVLDDEKYFTLSGSQMPGNDTFYSADKENTPPNIKHKFKKKFEPKLMLHIACSPRGISSAHFVPSGLAVNAEHYMKYCLKKIVIPFIRKHHSDGKYWFWPDKAKSHYAKATQQLMLTESIRFVPYEHNPTNFPQGRPIEDFFGQLAQKVYAKGYRAKSLKALKARVKKCLKEFDPDPVRRQCAGVRKKLRQCYTHGPYSLSH